MTQVDSENLVGIIDRFSKVLASSNTADADHSEICLQILSICSSNNYKLVTDFEWYVGLLIELSQCNCGQAEQVIADQIIDLSVRVPQLVPFLVVSSVRYYLSRSNT